MPRIASFVQPLTKRLLKLQLPFKTSLVEKAEMCEQLAFT